MRTYLSDRVLNERALAQTQTEQYYLTFSGCSGCLRKKRQPEALEKLAWELEELRLAREKFARESGASAEFEASMLKKSARELEELRLLAREKRARESGASAEFEALTLKKRLEATDKLLNAKNAGTPTKYQD